MTEYRPPAQLGNPSRTPPTLHGHAFLGRRAVTKRKGNKREGPGKKFVRNNKNSNYIVMYMRTLYYSYIRVLLRTGM